MKRNEFETLASSTLNNKSAEEVATDFYKAIEEKDFDYTNAFFYEALARITTRQIRIQKLADALKKDFFILQIGIGILIAVVTWLALKTKCLKGGIMKQTFYFNVFPLLLLSLMKEANTMRKVMSVIQDLFSSRKEGKSINRSKNL